MSGPDFVAAAPTLPGDLRLRLPPTSRHRYEGNETKEFHLHWNNHRLVARHRQVDNLSPSSTENADGARDPDMRQTKKGKQ